MTTQTPANGRALEGAILRQAVLGAAASILDAIYISDDTNNILPTVQKADANVSAVTANVRAVIVAVAQPGETAGVTGEAVTICVFGPVSGYAGMTPGARQFVSNTAGEITETAPTGAGTWTAPTGFAESDGVLFVMPGLQAPSSNS
jgi:hypothetical protein